MKVIRETGQLRAIFWSRFVSKLKHNILKAAKKRIRPAYLLTAKSVVIVIKLRLFQMAVIYNIHIIHCLKTGGSMRSWHLQTSLFHDGDAKY